jgi:hypothetical protein
MDRNFYLLKRVHENQHEISKQLATRQLLKKPEDRSLQSEKIGNPLILRYGPVVTIITILLVLGFLI